MVVLVFFVYFIILALVVVGLSSSALFVWGAMLSERDGFGVSSYLATFSPSHYKVTVGLFVFLYVISLVICVLKYKNFNNQIKKIMFIANFLCFYIFISSLIKGNSVLASISIVCYNGVAICVMWPVFQLYKNHRKIIFSFVFIQMALSVLILFLPNLFFLDGCYYKLQQGAYVVDMEGLNFELPSQGFNKSSVGKCGAFHNPNALGFYSVVSMVCAYYLAKFKDKKFKMLSMLFLGMGCVGWLNSLTRGPLIFLLIGYIYIYILSVKNRSGNLFDVIKLLLLLLLLLFIFVYFYLDGSGSFFDYLIPSSGDASVDGRKLGYEDSIYVMMHFPFFGVNSDFWLMQNKEIPHFLSLYFSAEYGIFAGILVSILVFFYGVVLIISASRTVVIFPGARSDFELAILLVFVCFGIATTNNLAAPVLFWFCFMEAQLLIFNRNSVIEKNSFNREIL